MIEASKSPDWPGRLTCDLVAKLNKKYRPDNVTSLADMTMTFFKLKLRKNDDPEDLEDDIAATKNEYCCQIDEKERKAFMVEAAEKYYADVIRNDTLRKGSSMTTEDPIEVMSETCRIAGGVDKKDSDDEDSVPDTALVSGNFP